MRRKIPTPLQIVCLIVWLITSCSEKPVGYAIATAHPLATQAGSEILAQNGNAFDAAVTISAVLAVVEPYSSGFGGGGFWLLHRRQDNRQIMLDGRERAPSGANRNMYLDKQGNLIETKSLLGPLAAGIPGLPAALVHLSKNYGILPLSVTLKPAIRYAREGFPADIKLVEMIEKRKGILSPMAKKIFLPNNKVPDLGDTIYQTDLADTIEQIVIHGFDGFYRSNVANKLVTESRSAGGIWTLADLATYTVVERDPIRFSFQGASITSATLPSSGGIVLAEILNLLTQLGVHSPQNSEDIHYIIEAMRLAYRDRAKWLGDADFVEVPQKKLISPAYAKQLAQQISARHAGKSNRLFNTQRNEGRDTTHFSIIDRHGNRVAATLSINYPFGSGFIAKGSGILFNNEMDDFSAKPGTPNIYGLIGGKANEIAPNKRMLSSMSPTFVDDGKRVAIIGTPGGSRIITMNLLGILRFLKGENAASIVAAKRFHHQYLPNLVEYETGALSQQTLSELVAKGHRLKRRQTDYGNMQVVIWDYSGNQLNAASDPRGIGTVNIK